jgi:hypothetical protein
MGQTALQAADGPPGNGQSRYDLRKPIMVAGLAVLACLLVVAMSAPASAIITDWRDGVKVDTTGSISTPSNSMTTVHGDGVASTPAPLSGYCESSQFPAAQAPWFQGGSITVTILDGNSNQGGNCNVELQEGWYHLSVIEHAFRNSDGSRNSAGIATYGHDEVVYGAECTRKDVFVGGTANYQDVFYHDPDDNTDTSATVDYFFAQNHGPAEAGAVCLSHKNANAGIMMPISANPPFAP